jgi:hypothetical protein
VQLQEATAQIKASTFPSDVAKANLDKAIEYAKKIKFRDRRDGRLGRTRRPPGLNR